jgi:hypothetical protein
MRSSEAIWIPLLDGLASIRSTRRSESDSLHQ